VTVDQKGVRGSAAGLKPCAVHVNLSIGRWTVSCLLDTGCEISLLPSKLAGQMTLNPYLHPMTAAYGTKINILGSKTFHIKLNGVKFEADMLVSNDVDEAMLGVSFLGAHDCSWHVNRGLVTIDRHILELHLHRRNAVCRRVVCNQTTLIPANSQQDVVVSVPLKNFNDSPVDVLLEPHELKPGVQIASCVLPYNVTTALVRVCNTNQRDVTLNYGTQITMAHGTQVVDDQHDLARATSLPVNRSTKVAEIIANLCTQLPATLTTDFKDRVAALLLQYEKILSVDDYDLGYTDILTHKIDTGANRPVREPL